MKIPRLSILLAALLVAATLLAGCSSSGAGSGAAADDSATTVAQETATLPDGTQFGYISQVSGGTLVFDPAEFLTGAAALAAARADGYIGPTETLDQNFYVRNDAEERLRLVVDPAATFILNVAPPQADLTTKTLSLDELTQLSASTTGTTGADGSSFSAGFPQSPLPIDLTISGGKVTGGKERYLP